MTEQEPLTPLSPREREVFYILIEGFKTKRIAEILKISPRTAEVHRRRIMKKLGILNGPIGLARWAIRNGLVLPALLIWLSGCTAKLEEAIALHDQNFKAVAKAHNLLEQRIVALEAKK